MLPKPLVHSPILCRRVAPILLAAILAVGAGFSVRRACAQDNAAPPLLVVISIDGLRPDYVTQADAHGAKLPNLRRFMKLGAYADGVQGVVPTVTYPSHTTLMTGVWPLKHGIYANTTFDPLQKNFQGWYWCRRHQGPDAVGCRRESGPHDGEHPVAGNSRRAHQLGNSRILARKHTR